MPVAIKFEKYNHIGVSGATCSEEPIIIGTRLQARFVANFGNVEDTMFAYPQLTEEQINEAKTFIAELDDEE